MKNGNWSLNIGARVIKDQGTFFRVWAPRSGRVAVRIISGKTPAEQIPLQREEYGYFSVLIPDVGHGDRYLYFLDNGPARPDPASRFQPDGVHEASQVFDPQLFKWQDQEWRGITLEDYLIYELHVGTFSTEGTFAGVIRQLDYLKELGITAVELMPVAQFPGSRNWGYDGAYPFAVQNSYGGPDGLKELVDACHAKGLAVIMDVVYNHLGPEGNYLNNFGFYFTDKYHTPWGRAINFDGPFSDQVRDYFISNALYWFNEYHIDALRLDAIHGIFDLSARHILRQMAEEVHLQREPLQKQIYLIAESDLNDVRVINPPEIDGHGVDAQWSDDLHHALHTLLTGENKGYYSDFGQISQLAKALRESFVYSGEFSRHRNRRHGNSARNRAPSQFVVFSQNHDQVGNRMQGDRLSASLPLRKLTLAAGVVMLSPYLPLIFMGEEYAEKAPFQYFVSHSDPALIEAVRKGRREEFTSFAEAGEAPDPQSEATFLASKIDPEQRSKGEHQLIHRFYRRLIELRKSHPALATLERENIQVTCLEENKVLIVTRQTETSAAMCLFSFSDQRQALATGLAVGNWKRILDSSEQDWGGEGEKTAASITVAASGKSSAVINPFSLLVYSKT
ncbi:MAG TPA: malto-oligosyltrehalose trehalohydrolase [Desulfuromonadaceae bacterium]|jgi:maltooligosyltrehalose trehalohydrolase